MRLVLFDFDGTLTRKDTLFEFIAFSRGRFRLFWGLFLNLANFMLFYLGRISNAQLKEIVLAHFFGGQPASSFNRMGEAFARVAIPSILRDEAPAVIERHQNNGSRVVIVTASCSNWIKPWSDQIGVELIATELEVVNGLITGKIRGKNCRGPEKVSRIHSHVDVKQYDRIVAYGDSKGDHQMLEMADESYFKTLG